jgi:hypothetical protein
MRFMLEDAGGRRVVFDGEQLARATSKRPGKDRWIELDLFKTNLGVYVLLGVGKTTIKDENEWRWTYSSKDPMSILTKLHRQDRAGGTYLTNVAHRLLTPSCPGRERRFLRDL